MVVLYTLWCSLPVLESSIRIGNRGGIRIKKRSIVEVE